MKLLISNEFGRLIENYSEIYIFTAWATINFPIYDTLVKNVNKIKKCIVGLHFYQTHPDFIENFLNNSNFRYIKNSEGTFHPKTYLFKNNDQNWECIIGSANFTKCAFHSNVETGVLVSSSDTDTEFISKLLNEIEYYWKLSSSYTEEDLKDYRELWKKFRPKLTELSNKYRKNKKRHLVIDLLSLSWNEYYSKVTKEDEYNSIDKRLSLLEGINKAFKEYTTFEAIPLEMRQVIAGLKKESGWFGSTVGAGTFKHIVKVNNKYLSSALEAIPISGNISKKDFKIFCKEFKKSHNYKNPICLATRLLCVKRPDYFICLNNANRIALCEALDSNKTITLDNYWDDVIERILNSNWWNATLPISKKEQDVFNARVAFLDAIYYK